MKRVEERCAINARKAERARLKAERDAQKTSQKPQLGKRKASQQQGVKKKKNRGDAAPQSGVGAPELPSAPLPTVNSRGRKTRPPQKLQ